MIVNSKNGVRKIRLSVREQTILLAAAELLSELGDLADNEEYDAAQASCAIAAAKYGKDSKKATPEV